MIPDSKTASKSSRFMAEFVKETSEVNEQKHIYLEMEKESFKKKD